MRAPFCAAWLVGDGLFLLADRLLKFWANSGGSAPRLVGRWLGWQPFFNQGVAFSLPVPNGVTIVLTVVILGVLIGKVWQLGKAARRETSVNRQPTTANSKVSSQSFPCLLLTDYCLLFIAYCLILTGALSNFYDRIFYQHTVDYLLVFTGVFNLADVMIVMGGILYLKSQRLRLKD